MSTYDLEEQEQLAVLKAWWKQYGGVILALIMCVSVIFAAWTGWNWYQRSQSGKAASLYEQMQKISRGGDLKTARIQLEWVISQARGAEIKAIARLRLASVLVDDNQSADAVKLLEAKAEDGFEGLYAAGRGDAFLGQKKYADAKSAYKAALESKKLDQGMRELVQIKLDALGDS